MIREIILSQRNSSRNSENAIASTRSVRERICHSSRKFRSDPSRTRVNHGGVASSFQERRSRGEYISGPRVLSRRISPPLPHMQHRYWQQPLIIPGTPTAIHNCHSHYNLHLGHCETVACVSTALLRRLSLIQLYSVDVPSYHYTARARSLARARSRSRKERGTGNSECRKEHGKSAPGTSLTSDSAINWPTARFDIRDVSSARAEGNLEGANVRRLDLPRTTSRGTTGDTRSSYAANAFLGKFQDEIQFSACLEHTVRFTIIVPRKAPSSSL